MRLEEKRDGRKLKANGKRQRASFPNGGEQGLVLRLRNSCVQSLTPRGRRTRPCCRTEELFLVCGQCQVKRKTASGVVMLRIMGRQWRILPF